MDDLELLVRETLHAHLQEAPYADRLMGDVLSRETRERRHRVAGGLLVATVLAGVVMAMSSGLSRAATIPTEQTRDAAGVGLLHSDCGLDVGWPLTHAANTQFICATAEGSTSQALITWPYRI